MEQGEPRKTEIGRTEEPTAIYGLSRQKGRMGPAQEVRRIRSGLPVAEFDALAGLLGIGADVLARHIGLSRSTLVRRRKAGHLDLFESDRLLRFARLWAKAKTVLVDDATARDWLNQPARALDFQTPLVFAETEVGAREVENLLGRIEHGVFS